MAPMTTTRAKTITTTMMMMVLLEISDSSSDVLSEFSDSSSGSSFCSSPIANQSRRDCRCWVSEERKPNYPCNYFRTNPNTYAHGTSTSQTDRQTDGWLTIAIHSASRGKIDQNFSLSRKTVS